MKLIEREEIRFSDFEDKILLEKIKLICEVRGQSRSSFILYLIKNNSNLIDQELNYFKHPESMFRHRVETLEAIIRDKVREYQTQRCKK